MTTFSIHISDRPHVAINGSIIAALRDAWRRHWHVLPGFVISLLVCAWMVTWGDFKFFAHETFCGYYDAQARSLLHGRFDVPPEAIGFEVFNFEGKAYGYFGIAPALLRIPLVVLFRHINGQWSRLFMMAGFLINLICAYRLVLWARGSGRPITSVDRLLQGLFVLCAGLGSTNIFLVSRSYTYHEAIMWGGVFALLFAVSLVKYLDAPSLGCLALLGAFAFMSFHCRPTAGAGALLAMCVLAVVLMVRVLRGMGGPPMSLPLKNTGEPPVPPNSVPPCLRGEIASASPLGFQKINNPLPHAIIAICSIVITVGVYFGVNYAKFRTFDGVPLKYYSLYQLNPSRMAVTGGRQIHPENIPMAMACYFGLRGAEIKKDFPWIFLCRRPCLVGAPSLDIVEQYSSIPVSMPALGLLALFGFVGVLRGQTLREKQMRLPIVALMLGGGIILMTVGITERYLHDLYPFLIAAGAVGIRRFIASNPDIGDLSPSPGTPGEG